MLSRTTIIIALAALGLRFLADHPWACYRGRLCLRPV